MTCDPITPYEIHSLNKILASFELQREWKSLSVVKSLQPIGFPFDLSGRETVLLKKQPSRMSMVFNFLGSSNNPSKVQSVNQLHSLADRPLSGTPQSTGYVVRLPLFRLLIQRVWGAFPGLIDLPIEAWLGIEKFIIGFNRRNFSTSRERGQFTKRAVISIGFTKLLSSYITSVIPFRTFLAEPSRPSQQDIEFISQLPRCVSSFGSRIKFIQQQNDKYLVIYRKKIQISRSTSNSEPSKISSSNVEISLVGWRVLFKLLKTVAQNKEYDETQSSISVLQKLFNSRHPQSEKLYQVLESSQLSPSSFDDNVQQELEEFLNDEQKFYQDWIDTGIKIHEAKQGYKKFLKKIVYDDGELDNMYNLAGKHEKLESILELDPMYEQAQSWVIMWIAYTLHFIFISVPDGDEICELLIKIDRLLPYELIKQGLRIINPTLAIRTTVALILGQPFGSLSLFQRILDSIVRHEIRTFEDQIETIVQSQSSNNQPLVPTRQKVYEAIKKFVYLDEEEKQTIRAQFDKSEEDIIILILRWSEDFDQIEIENIEESERIFKNSNDSVENNEFHDLIILLRLTSLKRDREQILEMILEPDNPIIRTIKQILENYHPTIYKIAQASDLSKKFGQTEAFLKDLIQLLVNRKKDNVTVDKLVKLLHQHKQSYWSFVNELVRYQDLCVPMKEWIRSCFDLIKSGLTRSVDASVTERYGLDFEKISSHTPIETVLEEARSLSVYNRLVKMVDNMQYRSVFCSSSFSSETDFLNQAFQFLCELHHPAQLKEHITQSRAEARPPLPFGWVWWIDEKKVDNRSVEIKLKDKLAEKSQGVVIDTNEHIALHQLVINSDLKELERLSQVFYVDELTKSINLFDRPENSSPPS